MKATVIALISMLSAGLLMPWVVQANPRPIYPTNELPTLTVQTPEPSSPLYANNTLELHFNVTLPQSWNSYYHGEIPNVATAETFLFLDGVLARVSPQTYDTVQQYTAVLANLTQQQHSVWIDIYCHILYTGSNVSVGQTLTFTIDAQAQTIAFHEDPVVTTSPGTRPIVPVSLPFLTLNPTVTPTPNPTSTETTPTETSPGLATDNGVFQIGFLAELAIATTIILALCLVVALISKGRAVKRGRVAAD